MTLKHLLVNILQEIRPDMLLYILHVTLSLSYIVQLSLMKLLSESTLGVSIHAQKLIEQPLLTSLEQITTLDSARMCQPWLHSDAIYKMMPAYKRHTKCRNMIFDFINEVLKNELIILMIKLKYLL